MSTESRQSHSAFYGWNDAWANPAFRGLSIKAPPQIGRIICPVPAIQSADDEYATLEQIHGIQRRVPQARLLVIQDCGHSPHRDQPEAVLAATDSFVAEKREG